jgi:translin
MRFVPNLSEVQASVEAITREMTRKSGIRDEAIADARQAVRHAANAVRALHRGDFDEASDLLEHAREIVGRIVTRTRQDPDLFTAGYVHDAMKEFAEAAITAAVLGGRDIPSHASLGIEGTAWLNALAEAGSELRRDVLDALRACHHERAESLLATMDELYLALVTVDFPDAMTGGLRRTVDQFRAVLERTRGDVTLTVQQRRLERAIAGLERRFDPTEVPE